MNVIEFLVQKGRYLKAQGKRRWSVALGWKTEVEFVRAKKFINEVSFIRTKWSFSNFLVNTMVDSVRMMIFILSNLVSQTASSTHLLPRASFRIVPPETLPWANLFWPVRPERILQSTLYKE